MSVYLGTQLLSGVATNTISNAHDLFDFKWVDHQLTDQSWLNADTFSWQDGTVYADAYNHLNADYNGGTSTTETIGSYTITYVLADDGHKITTDETTVANIYAESGVAWYYVIDQANTRFKLPRTKYGFEGLRDSAGKYVPESLPNITGRVTEIASQTSSTDISASGVFQTVKSGTAGGYGSSKSNWIDGFTFDASRSSSAYQDNAPVQQRATQMYLYFYVGQFSQSATEQTAGLNASLFNNKVDIDSSWGFPSGTYDDLTLGASGASYVAPANGYVYLNKSTGATNQDMMIVVGTTNDSSTCYSMKSSNPVASNRTILFCPVRKGETFFINYSVSGTTNCFRFYYAEA